MPGEVPRRAPYWVRVVGRAWRETLDVLSLHPKVVFTSLVAWAVTFGWLWYRREWASVTDQVYGALLGVAGLVAGGGLLFLYHCFSVPAQMMREAEDALQREPVPLAPGPTFPREIVVRQSLGDRARDRMRDWHKELERERRSATVRRLAELRTAGHQMLNHLERQRTWEADLTAKQAVQWYRNEVVELASQISDKATVLDSAFLVDDQGREVRNANPGVAPIRREQLRLYLKNLLRRLEGFLDDV